MTRGTISNCKTPVRIDSTGFVLLLAAMSSLLTFTTCQDGPTPLTAEVPLHLEDHLDAATISGSEIPADLPEPVEWHFADPQPDWKPAVPLIPSEKPVRIVRGNDSLRLMLKKGNRYTSGRIYVDLPDWNRSDWASVEVRARASEGAKELWIGFNLREKPGATAWEQSQYRFWGENVPLIADGSVHTYSLGVDYSDSIYGKWQGPWRQLGLSFNADQPSSVEVVSVRAIPKELDYAAAPVGVRREVRAEFHRRTLFSHAPGRLDYRVRIPPGGRLDLGLGVLRDETPVTFRVLADEGTGSTDTLLEETHADKQRWLQRSVDLSHLAGKTLTLALEAEADPPGTVALWAAPTLTGSSSTDRPNIIFYVIDGAAAEQMSVYGYNRRTTPNLERLAAEGAVFEHAYSNSTWTPTSTPSFMTSLHHSVLGGLTADTDPIPEQACTMAQHLHRAGYQTAVFTSNTFAGTTKALDREVDALREAGVKPTSVSSSTLHENFWLWRDSYPGEPYWVHFQTTDVHWPYEPGAPFAGLFVNSERRERFYEWERRLGEASGLGGPSHPSYPSEAYQEAGVDRVSFFDALRGLYDEDMAHNDYQIGKLVERLKATGEWDRTLLIIAADHANFNATLQIRDPAPPKWGPMFQPGKTHIPMIFVWPGHIDPGQRFSQPVSMIDILPTILDLARLPEPDIMQGQSLAPLLLRKENWRHKPVILDEFYVDRETGELSGHIEVIDGRWGASLEIDSDGSGEGKSSRAAQAGRPAPLLVYDLWNDPYCLKSLHEERRDLVKKYSDFLNAQFEAHKTLAKRFTPGEDSPLHPEQLKTLRSLGYIQ